MFALSAKIPHSELIQMKVFLIIFTLTSLALMSTWLDLAYAFNNGVLLAISLLPLALPNEYKIYFLFSFLTALSGVIDAIIIFSKIDQSINSSISFLGLILGLIFACVLLVLKPFIALSEYQIACFLSDQPKINLAHMPFAFFDHTDMVPKLSIFVPEEQEVVDHSSDKKKIYAESEASMVPATPTTPVTIYEKV